jgi:hypothetical protein
MEGISPNVLQLSTSLELMPYNYDTSGMSVRSDVNEADQRPPVDLDKSVDDSFLVTDGDGGMQVSNLGLSFFHSWLV